MKRLGVVIPSSNTTVEKEFNEALHGLATVHTARITLRRVDVDELSKFEDDVVHETLKLADAGVDVIGLACTSGSFVKGSRQYLSLEERMAEAAGVPCVTASGAVLRTLETLDCRRVALVTPYVEEVTRLEEKLLRENGFQVTASRWAGILENTVIGNVSESEVFKWVTGLNNAGAEAVFISCTNLKTFGILARLESAMKMPVFSSNSATLWDMARNAGISLHGRGLGRLYEITPYL